MSSQTTDFIVEQVRLKEKVLGFLQAQDILKSVEQSCVILHQKHSSNKQPQNHCFDPIIVNLNLRFGNIDEGWFCNPRVCLLLLVPQPSSHFSFSNHLVFGDKRNKIFHHFVGRSDLLFCYKYLQ